MFLVENQREYSVLNLSDYILLFLGSIKPSRYRTGIKFDKGPLAKQLLDQNCKSLHCL